MTEDHVDWNPLCLIPSKRAASESTLRSNRVSSVDDDSPPVDIVLQSLDDSKCRTILGLLTDPKSASDLCGECELPSSTVYRKLELLREAALVKEYTEVRRDGPNATLYERDFTDISISVTDEEFTVDISRPETDAEDSMATFWAAMKEESK